jgi:hypothetical protein
LVIRAQQINRSATADDDHVSILDWVLWVLSRRRAAVPAPRHRRSGRKLYLEIGGAGGPAGGTGGSDGSAGVEIVSAAAGAA